ncbi:hypothetical protein V6N13_071826 [Hibiscus sabdariffa]
MDGFGPDCVNVNEKDKEPGSETENSENLYNSDRPRYPEFNSDMDMKKPKFVKGLVFPNRIVLNEAIKQYETVNRLEVKLKKNDKQRLQATCKEGCPWKLWTTPLNSKNNMSQTRQIKTMVNSHNCSKAVANRNITTKWMAKYYIGKFMSEPNHTMRSLVHDVLHEFGTLVFTGKCGIDANYCIYPITYATVESENMFSWHWFLDILKTDLDIENTFSIAFMSDRQKGLKEVTEDLFPIAEDRKCVRHMYTNFKEKHKGQALTDAVWKASRATYLREFEDAMYQLKALSKDAYNWIKGKDPSQWSISHFSTEASVICSLITTYILEARDKPILTMMETIRTKIMTQIVSKREAVEKCSYQWAPVTDMEPILPPIIRRSRGRPTKRRRLEPDEVTKPKLS